MNILTIVGIIDHLIVLVKIVLTCGIIMQCFLFFFHKFVFDVFTNTFIEVSEFSSVAEIWKTYHIVNFDILVLQSFQTIRISL